MNYTLHQLQIFQKIAELKSITKASEELHLTQPAVSIQLKNFQDQFPIPLTEVVGRQLYITDFGMEIARTVSKILTEVEAINYKTRAFQGEISGRLTISIASTGKYVMPYFLSGFMRKHPGVDLVMDVTNKSLVVESLERNAVDFALVSVLPEKLKVNTISLMPNSLYYVSSSDFDIADGESDEVLFEKMPLIYREPGSATRNAMENFIAQRKFSITKKMELTSNEAVKQAVLAGLGCSIMPVIGLRNELKSQKIKIVPVNGLPINTFWNLIWLQAKNLSPVAKAFVEYLEAEKEVIIERHFDYLSREG
ncbi:MULTISPECIES: LysR family transcriptional regulator [unclassified Leeuwenhoekiella]|uniref:LysR family transcriptional regulator n=1 Tax=unclassified Leeuwenhoekiella TaxID=2615029 RepID=UPI000C441FB6|nr:MULTISPECIES: LysR family transcriptional regulator [unclassified Leeuwenhoekiella]MAW96909.1 LysR family transcriptional regulator [Leeuwenhoekiella sp.]MBA80613.1 LysR family transcriptional regulator [Leeuwenhoekiella sp.]|tara:strand:- start:25895 stop:26821 length:927 start_codon:yes stop_codon:yes gene_type:complete